MLPGSPLIWVAVVGWLAAAGTYGFQKLKQGQVWQTAYGQGVTAGKGSASTATVAAATETANAERQAFDTTPLPPSKAAIVDLCKRSASCREKGTLK